VAGTRQVAEFGRGSTSLFLGPAAELAGVLVFGVSIQFEGGAGLWRSDGTAAGTYRLTPTSPRGQNWTANPSFLVHEGLLFFAAAGDDELWISDGTVEGTHLLLDVAIPEGFVPFGGALYFTAGSSSTDRGLFRSDGTQAGTSQVPLPAGVFPSMRSACAAATASRLFFCASDSLHGSEPWSFDGVATARIADLQAGPESSLRGGFGPHFLPVTPHFAQLGDVVVFFADDGIHGREPWRSDGTAAGTELVADLTPGPGSSMPHGATSVLPPVVLQDTLLYRTESPTVGRILWRTDGTGAGTAVVAVLDDSTSAFLPSMVELGIGYEPITETCFLPFQNEVVFSARDGIYDSDLWRSNGTLAGTNRVVDLPDVQWESTPRACRPIQDRVVFGAGAEADAFDLLATDGTPGNLVVLAAGQGASWLESTSNYADRLYLAGSQGLWSTDGTVPGTLFEGSGYGLAFGQVGVFAGSIVLADGELFAMNPEAPSGFLTELVDLNGVEASWPHTLTELGNRLLFFAWTEAEGQELRATDGGGLSTRASLLKDIRPGRASGIADVIPAELPQLATRLVAVGNRAVFSADDGIAGEELWTTDGTAAGTVLLEDLYPGPYPSTPRLLTRCGAWACFVAESPEHGRELWRTDGLPGGTHLVADLVPGTGSSVPEELTAAGSDLYFSAWTPGAGREPWRLSAGASSDPPVAPLADVAPGPLSSSPLAFLEVGGRVFFPANDNVLGFELWSVQEPDSVFSDGFESSGTTVWSQALP
jgi:ELWxxDGT repeat protein